ncbi:MAG: DUF5615 family PIN-like protein [bacterium]
MRFKIDENLPVEIAGMLESYGYDALTVYDESLTGEQDRLLAEICQREKRIFLTLDMDFSDIRNYPPKDFPGIMVIRTSRQDKESIISMFCKVLPLLESEPIEKHLWIIEKDRVRIRE